MGRPRVSKSDAVRLLGAGMVLDAPPRPQAAPTTPKPPRAGLPARTDVLDGPTRVLGLDLALGCTGWCLLVGGQPAAHGSFDLPGYQRKGESLTAFLTRRADALADQVGLLVRANRPELVGYEYPNVPRPHYSGGSKGREFSAVQGLSRAEGFLIVLWGRIGAGVPLVAVPMTEAKRAATGRVGANKDQIKQALMERRLWDLRGWTDDEVDAAAVALAAREGIGA